jgi:hypothetical protein
MRTVLLGCLVACGGSGQVQPDAAADAPILDATSDAAPDTAPVCGWVAETVATTADPGRPVIAVTADGDVHILFYDPTACHTLHYATRPAGATAWTVTALDDHVGQDYQYFSLASDDASGLHAAFYKGTPVTGCGGGGALGVQYGYKPAGGAWGRVPVASPQNGGQDLGIALDGADPQLVYNGPSSQPTLQYAHRITSSWTVETVPSPDPIGSFPSIRIDAAHRAHVIAMGEVATVGMAYAERSATGAWTTTTIDVDPAGGVHVAYGDGQLVMHYGYRPPGGSWSTTALDTDHVMSHDTIRIDSTGTLHVIYSGGSPFNGIPLKVRHAHATIGGAWTTEPIGTDEGVFGTSLALDTRDAMHLAYARMNGGAWDVRYAHLVCQ